MSLSLHIAQGNARRVAGKKGPAKLLAADQRVAGAMRLGLITRKLSAVTNEMNARREMRHHPPAPDKQPITESPTMRSFNSKGITSPVVFKAIGFSRRVQLWNRQASIIMYLTTLALRHGWRCLPAYEYQRSVQSVGAIHGRVTRERSSHGYKTGSQSNAVDSTSVVWLDKRACLLRI